MPAGIRSFGQAVEGSIGRGARGSAAGSKVHGTRPKVHQLGASDVSSSKGTWSDRYQAVSSQSSFAAPVLCILTYTSYPKRASKNEH